MNDTILWFACPASEPKPTLHYPGGVYQTNLEPLAGDDDDERTFTVDGFNLILRRVHCVITDGLLRRGAPKWKLCPQTKAALLWQAFRRYSELVGLKRLSGGLSGSDVLVFRPRLRPPQIEDSRGMATSGSLDVLDGSWGTPLLVKTGPLDDVFREWNRSETFLRDRRSPFLARIEEYLNVEPPGVPAPECRATMIGSFLGGELIQAEPFDKLVRGCRDTDRCLRIIDQVGTHLGTWHTNAKPRPLLDWPRVFRFADGVKPADRAKATWLAFGRFNFRKAEREKEEDKLEDWDIVRPDGQGRSLGRSEFAKGVGWDIPLGQKDHLQRHLLGSLDKRDGLLHRLAKMRVLYSLIHGDLNPRNILCDADRVWLLDFEKTGVGPVLADLARLEVNLRLWCISLVPAKDPVAEYAQRLEHLLLDHFHESESSLEPVRELAAAIGADPNDLEKVARCIAHIRRLARRWCVPEFTDGRDYLAVLYLTVLSLLPLAGQGHTGPGNERWVVELGWVLEETLDRLLDHEPFARDQYPYDPLHHVSAELLRAPDAPLRVHHLCLSEDGREALQPVAALQGVLQGGYHHLDAYQHTLSVLAYLEAILADPVGGLLNPAQLDATVAQALASDGIDVPPPTSRQANPSPVDPARFATHLDRVREWLAEVLDADSPLDSPLVLKWCGLLHDVGKPGTRTLRKKDGRLEVQFLGHEQYGVALLRSQLAAWFPGDAPEKCPVSELGQRLAALIENHHRSHQLISDYLLRYPGLVAELDAFLNGTPNHKMKGWLRTLTTPGHEDCRPDLPLLLLHGYADRLASRGIKQSGTVTDWAGVTLGLLIFLARDREWRDADAQRAANQTPAVEAAKRYATELRDQKCFRSKLLNPATQILLRALGDRSGTADELYAYLRETLNCETLNQLLNKE